MTVRVVLRGRIGLGDLDTLSQGLQPLLSREAPPEVDLRELIEISAAPMALLTATLRYVYRQRGCDVLARYRPPELRSLRARLDVATLAEFFTDEAGSDIAVARRPPGFGGCEPFCNGEGVTRAAASLEANLRTQVDPDETTAVTLAVMISDFAENVWQHSDADGGVAAMEFLPERGVVELGVADCGIGIPQSLRRNPEYAHLIDDVLAVRNATRAGVTGDPGSGGGLGLYLARLVLAENRGTLIVRSGNARLEHLPQTNLLTSAPPLKGTLVAVRARLDRPLDYGIIDRLLKKPGGAREG